MVKFLIIVFFIIVCIFIVLFLFSCLFFWHNDKKNKLTDKGKQLYCSVTKRSYDVMLDPYPDISFDVKDIDSSTIGRVNFIVSCNKIRKKWLFPQLYYDFLNHEYDMYSYNFKNYLNNCILKVSKSQPNLFDEYFCDFNMNIFIMDIQQDILPKFQGLFEKRMDAIDPQRAYLYTVNKYTPGSDIEELELKIYITQNEKDVKQGEKSFYANDDMNRMKQLMDSIPSKIESLNAFNTQLQKIIEEYEQKAVKSIEVSYGSVLQNTNINSSMYYKSFNTISAKYSSKITPAVAMACDAAVKKVSDLINQKSEIIKRNFSDIDKYNQVLQKLQQQYDDEFALQKIKELNRDVNSQMNNTDDIAHKEENNIKINNILDDIAQLDNEVNERRNIEISQGLIEI